MVDFVLIVELHCGWGVEQRGQKILLHVPYLKKLENSDDRRRLAEKFGLPLLEGKFDTTQNGVSEKLVKLLCNKGMVDPFDDLPMEVSSPRKWE